MTEYKCGSAKKCMFGDMCKPLYDIGGCSHYREKRPQTNEEWLKSCNTEQLAEALLNIMANNEFTLYLLHTEKKSVQEIKGAVVEWLKQPHTDS